MAETKQQVKEDLKILKIDRQRPKRRGSSRRKWIIGAVIIGLLGIGLFFSQDWGKQLGITAKPVRVAVVTKRNSNGAEPVLSASGYIIARHQVEVGSKITGRVVQLDVDEGYTVERGQLIAKLDDYEISAQVNQAQANVAAAKARLAELEAGSRPQEIERAKAETERLQADLNNAEINLRRMEQLVEKKVLEQQALDDARARYDMARKAYQAAQETYELARIGPRQEQIDLARAQVNQAEAELALAQAQLQNTIIRAPVSGTILDRYVDLGEMVTTGFTSDRGAKQALVSIANLSDLQVEMDISEADFAKVQLNQPTAVTPDAFQDRRYDGVVEYIADVADRQKATIQVKVKVLNPDKLLRPDMGAKVTFYQMGATVPQQKASVIVPKAAVATLEGRTVVFIARDGKAVLQPVKVGPEEAGYVPILEGLQGGESVIVNELDSLEDGDKIMVQS